MIHEYALPAQLNGSGLEHEVRQATGRVRVDVWVDDTTLYVFTHADRAEVDPVVADHAGQPDPDQQAEIDKTAVDNQRIDQLDQLREKALAVWQGTDTFTTAQAQRIIAGLVLLELRKR